MIGGNEPAGHEGYAKQRDAPAAGDPTGLFRWGFIFPPSGLGVRRDGYEFYQVAPANVILMTIGLGDFDYTTRDGVEQSVARVGNRADRLASEGADRIVIGGVPISAFLGRQRLRQLLEETHHRTETPTDAPLEAVLAAMRHLRLTTLAIASRWAADVNEAVVSYLLAGGVEIVGTTERGQKLSDAMRMTIEGGARMALEVGMEAGRKFPAADAIYVPGGAALSLHVITPLERAFEKPVMTSLSAELWHGLVQSRVRPPIQGWGALLASDPA